MSWPTAWSQTGLSTMTRRGGERRGDIGYSLTCCCRPGGCPSSRGRSLRWLDGCRGCSRRQSISSRGERGTWPHRPPSAEPIDAKESGVDIDDLAAGEACARRKLLDDGGTQGRAERGGRPIRHSGRQAMADTPAVHHSLEEIAGCRELRSDLL